MLGAATGTFCPGFFISTLGAGWSPLRTQRAVERLPRAPAACVTLFLQAPSRCYGRGHYGFLRVHCARALCQHQCGSASEPRGRHEIWHFRAERVVSCGLFGQRVGLALDSERDVQQVHRAVANQSLRRRGLWPCPCFVPPVALLFVSCKLQLTLVVRAGRKWCARRTGC